MEKEIKKQTRWFRTDVDFENSFKFWFALQWQNTYIQIFAVSFTLLFFQICNFGRSIQWFSEAWDEGVGSGIMVSMGLLLPLLVTVIISYKGFWQYFNDLKHGRSR